VPELAIALSRSSPVPLHENLRVRPTRAVCVHGIVDTWRTWELVLDSLEARHDAWAPAAPHSVGGTVFPYLLWDE
jgi:hypothetical protein